ncbi:serine/arginine repetitive matrix protein 1-like [Acanthopagrus latus]|uniref:serine/arginine repetitive matrix protein 1-like n=1 Tax=Acanthopagrus latus TaxID=8177 RepID=UPI00187C7233|nr:serine/arginine repetitive matrix protein 1-like [Acanthopagrus latus]
MPEGKFSFGIMSTPGAHAAQLRTEVLHAKVPRSPDAVCVLAPSNNLTASRTVDEAAVDYARFLTAVRSRWSEEPLAGGLCGGLPPPRLNEDEEHQRALRHAYHRVTARMGLRYFSVEEYFPRTRLDLWSRDGVHLSDREGMGILTQLLWASTEQFLETPPPPPPPPVSPTPSQPLRKVSPKLVVKGEVRAPLSPDPFQWKVVGQSSKPQVPGPASVAQQQEKESFLPLNPRWFSSTTLCAMEEVSPSQLSDVVDVPSPPARKKVASPAAARRHRTTERRPPCHQSPVNNQVGSPPARLSRRLEDDGPSSPVPLSRTTDGTPPRTQTSVTNQLVGSPPVRLSCSLGDPTTPCCSPVAKVARMKTPSPVGPSQTIKAACHSPRPVKVNHSQAVNLTPTQLWVVVHDDGTILAAHCTCKAGLGEASILTSRE